jgi:hypothetical protein
MPSGYRDSTGLGTAWKHGGRGTPEYVTWKRIKNRCYNANTPDFKYYGARGIVMDEDFKNDFTAFLEHVGKKPSPEHTIERIDNDKGYVRGNLKWATRAEQSNNNRRCRFITYNGQTRNLAQHCQELGLKRATVEWWIYQKGLDPVAAFDRLLATR